MAAHQVEIAGENMEAWYNAMRSAKFGLLMTALAVLVVLLATFGVSPTDDGGAAAGPGKSRFHSLVIDDRVPVRTMQSLLYFTVTVLALNNAVHP